jgi:NADH-quinone oxidoreductase subunit N
MASIVKVGAFAALVRVLISALGTQLDTWRPILFVLIVLTTVVGASLAVVQRNAKRMLAYSSINHAGFILLGIWAGTVKGTAATLFYVMTYAPVVVATFAVVTLVGGVGDEHHSIDHYRGLARRQPWLGASLAVLLLSQLGAPLTTGFYAKFSVLGAAVDAGGSVLAVIALLSAAIAAFFYLRWTTALYADDEIEATRVEVPALTGIVIGAGAIFTIAFGIWPGPLAALAQHATVFFTP